MIAYIGLWVQRYTSIAFVNSCLLKTEQFAYRGKNTGEISWSTENGSEEDTPTKMIE